MRSLAATSLEHGTALLCPLPQSPRLCWTGAHCCSRHPFLPLACIGRAWGRECAEHMPLRTFVMVSMCLWGTSEALQRLACSCLHHPSFAPHRQERPRPPFLASTPSALHSPCPHVALHCPPPVPYPLSPGCVPPQPCSPCAIGRRARLDVSHLLLTDGEHVAGRRRGWCHCPAPQCPAHRRRSQRLPNTGGEEHLHSCSFPLCHVFSSFFIYR